MGDGKKKNIINLFADEAEKLRKEKKLFNIKIGEWKRKNLLEIDMQEKLMRNDTQNILSWKKIEIGIEIKIPSRMRMCVEMFTRYIMNM